MVAQPTYDNLISEISDVLTLHYRTWSAAHPDDEVYAYVIYATALVSDIAVSVLSEQGLLQVAADYKNSYGYEESLDQLAKDLRWSVADTPYCGDYQELFASVNHRLHGMIAYVDSLDVNDPAFTAHTGKLYSILVDALNLFRQNTLGGETRPLLYVDFGDMSDKERLMFIEQCNVPDRVKWFRSSIEPAE